MVIGNPITHSKSPGLHALVYEEACIDAILLPFAGTDIRKLVEAIKALSVGLTAVTMPFKQSAMSLLDRVDRTAQAIGAINTIINHNGKLLGYNTDAFGIQYAIRNTKLRNKKVLLLGAGGGARAAAYVFKKAGSKLLYANRTSGRAKELKRKFGGQIVNLAELTPASIDVIVNATPVGMNPGLNNSPVPETLLAKHQIVFDFIYNPVRTKLLRFALRQGAKTISGLEMFVAQGVRQAEIWSGKKIITEKLVGRIKKQIEKTL